MLLVIYTYIQIHTAAVADDDDDDDDDDTADSCAGLAGWLLVAGIRY